MAGRANDVKTTLKVECEAHADYCRVDVVEECFMTISTFGMIC